MGQVLIRNIDDDALEAFRLRAKLKGTSLEQEIRQLIEDHAPFSPEERVRASREARSRIGRQLPSLTLDQIREGLE